MTGISLQKALARTRNEDCPHRVGDPVTFSPAAFFRREDGTLHRLHGRVVYVNAAHRYYTVEAPCWDYTIRESFKF